MANVNMYLTFKLTLTRIHTTNIFLVYLYLLIVHKSRKQLQDRALHKRTVCSDSRTLRCIINRGGWLVALIGRSMVRIWTCTDRFRRRRLRLLLITIFRIFFRQSHETPPHTLAEDHHQSNRRRRRNGKQIRRTNLF